MRRFLAALSLLSLLLSLTACGGSPSEAAPSPEEAPGEVPAPEEPPAGEDTVICLRGDVEIALPTRYLDQLIVDTDFSGASGGTRPLLSVYEKASADAGEAGWGQRAGFLFGLLALDQTGYEQFLCEDPPGAEVIARDEDRYYVHTFPTDVQFYRPGGEIDTDSAGWENWTALAQLDRTVLPDFIRRNGLTPFAQEFPPYTWEGEHQYLRSSFGGGDCVLVLSQPVRQGEGGLWCVDRWLCAGGTPTVYFPDSGLPAAQYYAGLQARCDAGERLELLTPAGAAADFARDRWGSALPEDHFQPLDAGSIARTEADLRLRALLSALRGGETVDGMTLLDCLGLVGADNWASLNLGAFGLGGDWWTPLLPALTDAAQGDGQLRRDRNLLAFRLLLQDDPEARREAVDALLQVRRQEDGAVFLQALDTFSPEEQAVLNQAAGAR